MSIVSEIEDQKVGKIVKECRKDAYKYIDSMLGDVALEGYEEGFADGADSIINTCIRLSSYDKDVLIGIFFDDTYTEDNEKNPIKAILTLMSPDTINSKLDAFDKECNENKKEVSAILKLMSDKNGRIHTVKIGEKKDEYEFELIQQVRDTAKRISEYSCEELLDIFGVAGLPEYRFSQYLMDYSVNQINAKLDEYDSKIRMKAGQEKVSNETLEKFAKCIDKLR